jgi:hypothetical protein
LSWPSFAWGAVALGLAACSSSGAPLGTVTPPASSLPTPFAPLAFTVMPYGPQVTAGWECVTGILTSRAQFPKSVARANGAGAGGTRAPQSVFIPGDGCDDFPAPSPVPTPPGPAPSPLAATTLSTAQIGASGLGVALPSALGWQGTVTWPGCGASACDAGTSNGTIALNVTTATTSSSLALALVFTNTGPETLAAPTPAPAIHPAPHVYELYGPPVAAGASPQPTPAYVSGAPVTLGFPTLAIGAPSGVDATKLVLTLVQRLKPPTYEEAIYDFDASGNPIALPLTSTATYHPATASANTATFVLPSTPFPFQTDFTEYDLTIAPSS